MLRSRLVLGSSLLGLAASLSAQDPAAAAHDAPRVLVLGFTAKAEHEVYRQRAVDRVRELALARGLRLVDAAQAQLLEEKRRKLTGGGELPPTWLEESGADVVLRVELAIEEERSAQGRNIVRDRLRLAAVASDDAQLFFERSATGNGRALRGPAEAHAAALEEALGADGALVQQFVGALAERDAQEAQHGPLYRLSIHTGAVGFGMPVFTGAELENLPGVSELEQESADGQSSTYRLRFRGKRHELEAALFRLVGEKSEALREKLKADLGAELSASRRRMELVLGRREAAVASVTEELSVAMERLARGMYELEPAWYEAATMRFEPAMIPSGASRWNELVSFASAFWRELDKIQKANPDKDPYTVEGSVKVAGTIFPTLGDAREHAEKLAKSYYESPAGVTAMALAAVAETAFGKASDGKISAVVDDLVQSSILYTIKSEDALFQEEDAVEESSVAFFQRRGANRLAAVRLVKPFDAYRLQLTIVDLANGVKRTRSTEIPTRFTEVLDRQING
ncbi:MAG: hypothetical protein JNM84_20895 [Planctomycetes bacterium]|nr:hypothetical protein [Planctomycetota bacterium]